MSLKVHVIEVASDPVAAPAFVGQHWINTASTRQWLAYGTSSVSDWKEILTSAVLDEQVRDVIAAAVQDSSTIDFTNNDAGDTMSLAVIPSGVDHNSLANLTTGNPHTQYLLTSTAASTYQPLDGDLTAVAALAGTGLVARTASNTMTTRTLTASTGMTVSNGDGVSGNPTVSITNSGVTASTYGSATQVPQIAVNAQGQATSASNVSIAIPSTQITDFAEAVEDVMGGALVDSSSVDFQYNDGANTQTAVVLPAGVDHNSLQNFVANKHIDHSAVSITAGTYLSGGGDITTSRTLNHANSPVTPSSYGGVNAIPVLTVAATGHVEAASTVNTTSALLTGLNATLGGASIVATDTILQAFNKILGTDNNWIEVSTSSTYTNSSATTGVTITEFNFTAVTGRRYYYEATLLYQTAATTTGIGITAASPDTFVGPGALMVNVTTGPDGTASLYTGTINALNDYVTSPSVQTANTPFVAHIKGNFPCTTGGTISLLFRSEVAGSLVTVSPGSTLLVREFP